MRLQYKRGDKVLCGKAHYMVANSFYDPDDGEIVCLVNKTGYFVDVDVMHITKRYNGRWNGKWRGISREKLPWIETLENRNLLEAMDG